MGDVGVIFILVKSEYVTGVKGRMTLFIWVVSW